MKRLATYVLLGIATSVLAYYLTILYLPNAIYAGLSYRLQQSRGVASNELIYVDLPTDTSRNVVMPNPDFLYIACFYDVSECPQRITGTMPDATYWSLAFYQPNTVNWYIKNDRQFGTPQLDVTISKAGDRSMESSSEIAYSPVDKGFMLIRILVTDNAPERLAAYKALQASVRLEDVCE